MIKLEVQQAYAQKLTEKNIGADEIGSIDEWKIADLVLLYIMHL